jgi:hypothetical protein
VKCLLWLTETFFATINILTDSEESFFLTHNSTLKCLRTLFAIKRTCYFHDCGKKASLYQLSLIVTFIFRYDIILRYFIAFMRKCAQIVHFNYYVWHFHQQKIKWIEIEIYLAWPQSISIRARVHVIVFGGPNYNLLTFLFEITECICFLLQVTDCISIHTKFLMSSPYFIVDRPIRKKRSVMGSSLSRDTGSYNVHGGIPFNILKMFFFI